MPHSILILCPDFITERMAGPAIRYWEFSKALAGAHPVTLAVPNDLPPIPPPHPQVKLTQHTLENIAELISHHDIIIFQGYILDRYPLLRQNHKILIADLYDPVPLEGLEQHKGEENLQAVAHQVRMMNEQLEVADYFLCANSRQRDLWLGHLLALGRINPLTYTQIQQRLLVVPFGLPDTPPQRSGPGFRSSLEGAGFVLLWGGGIWEWFDPLTLIRAVHRLLPRQPDLKLVFLGTQHPNTTIQAMPMQHRAETLAQELGLYGTHVIFQTGWVAYEKLPNHLLDADVGVSAHFDTLETYFSFRTRILHYLWAGKPIITTQGDVLAQTIAEMKAGIIVKPQDEEDWISAIETLRSHYTTYLEGVKTMAQHYRWSEVIQPLQNLCTQATRSPDLGIRKFPEWDCEQEYKALKCQLEIIEHSNSWRMTAPLREVRRWLTKKH